LKKSSEFNINPFLAVYLANFLTGNSSGKSIAKALIYPRILGTSITTSFGTNIQKFTNDVLDAFGSTTPGIDIEFIVNIQSRSIFISIAMTPEYYSIAQVADILGVSKETLRRWDKNRKMSSRRNKTINY
jgi:hypothetical protein